MVRCPPRAAVSRPVASESTAAMTTARKSGVRKGKATYNRSPVESRSRATKEREGRATRSVYQRRRRTSGKIPSTRPVRATRGRANGSEQLVDPERLPQDRRVELGKPVRRRRVGREDQDRDRGQSGIGSLAVPEFVTVDSRHHQVEQDQHRQGIETSEHVQALRAILAPDHLVALHLQKVADTLGDTGVVLDEEDRTAGGGVSAHRRGRRMRKPTCDSSGGPLRPQEDPNPAVPGNRGPGTAPD